MNIMIMYNGTLDVRNIKKNTVVVKHYAPGANEAQKSYF